MKRILLFLIVPLVFICSSAKVMAANLYLSNLTVNTGTLSPTFAGTTIFNYTVAVSSTVTTIKFTPTQLVNASTIKINGGAAVASGTQSAALTLNPGANTFNIVVTKAGNTTETYTIIVNRESINYAGTPFTYNAGTPIATASSTELGDNPTGYSGILPTGLSVDPITGDITGTPTTASAATNYTITASYGGGVTATATVNITVLAPTINYAGSPFTYNAGTPITTASSTETNGNPTTYSGTLPAGLTLNTSTGDITAHTS